MSPKLFLQRAVDPGLALLPSYMTCDCSRVILMSIAGQETNWAARIQSGGGPAHGYWQFQIEGVNEVIEKQGPLANAVLKTLDIPITEAYAAVQYNDLVACVFARLLLWNDPAALPAWGDLAGSFGYYNRNWRPGKPDQTRWGPAYSSSMNAIQALR